MLSSLSSQSRALRQMSGKSNSPPALIRYELEEKKLIRFEDKMDLRITKGKTTAFVFISNKNIPFSLNVSRSVDSKPSALKAKVSFTTGAYYLLPGKFNFICDG